MGFAIKGLKINPLIKGRFLVKIRQKRSNFDKK